MTRIVLLLYNCMILYFYPDNHGFIVFFTVLFQLLLVVILLLLLVIHIVALTIDFFNFNFQFKTALFETIPIITNYKNITKAADPQWGRIKTVKFLC